MLGHGPVPLHTTAIQRTQPKWVFSESWCHAVLVRFMSGAVWPFVSRTAVQHPGQGMQ